MEGNEFSLSGAVILTICIKTDLPVGAENLTGVDELLEWTEKLWGITSFTSNT